jgi:glutamine amidotransferase
MCRHLAYLGPPIALGSLLFDAPHSLCEQGARPWHQAPGRVNKDGWGVGWFDTDGHIDDRYYRTTTSMWDDRKFPYRDVESGAFVAAARLGGHRSPRSPRSPHHRGVAAVRSATAGMPVTPPRRRRSSGRWLFSHNGVVRAGPGGGGSLGAAGHGPADTGRPHRLHAVVGAGPPPSGGRRPGGRSDRRRALRRRRGPRSRLNLPLTDSTAIWATTWTPRLGPQGRAVTVASEPSDASTGWVAVPDRSLVVATPQLRRQPWTCRARRRSAA